MDIPTPSCPRDVIFTFEHSCNSRCCKFMFCCCCNTINPEAPVYITSDGRVKEFNSRVYDPNKSAQRSIENLLAVIQRISETQVQMAQMLQALEQRSIPIRPERARVLKAREVKEIEEVAIPLIHRPIR
jgi:hypothetical protein